jgi:hypothetical protein
MNFIKFINESLNKPFKFNWISRTNPRPGAPGTHIARFDAGTIDRPMEIVFVIFKYPWGKRVEVEFSDLSESAEKAIEKTGKGTAFRIFATVAHVVLSFLTKNKDVMAIEFSAEKKDRSRTRLYMRFIKNIPGFDYFGYDKHSGFFCAIRSGAPKEVYDYYEDLY